MSRESETKAALSQRLEEAEEAIGAGENPFSGVRASDWLKELDDDN